MSFIKWVLNCGPDILDANDQVLALVLNMPISHYICIGCVWEMRLSNHQKSLWTKSLWTNVQVVKTFEIIKL